MPISEWHWEVTRKCNLACIHCLYGDSVAVTEMDQAQARHAIDRIVMLGGQSLKITGGEPLVRVDLPGLISHADRAGLEVEMITNGTLLTEKFLDSVGDCLRHVAVSIDGLRKVHDTLRGAGSFELAVAALQRLMIRDMTVSVSITISALNFPELFQLLKFLESRGVENFHICDLSMVGNARKNRHVLNLDWNDKTRQQLFEVLERAFGYTLNNAAIDTACNIEPSTVCLRANGALYACAEIMLTYPTDKIGMIHDPDITERVQAYYTGIDSTEECRYTSYAWPGVSLILTGSHGCPLTRGGV